MTFTLTERVKGLLADEGHQVSAAWKVRLQCLPHGHFALDLAVIQLDDGLFLTCPLAGLDSPAFASEFAELVDNAQRRAPRETRGHIRQSGDKIGLYGRHQVTVQCASRKCSYRGEFEYYSLSADVGAAAARGHDRYRLTD